MAVAAVAQQYGQCLTCLRWSRRRKVGGVCNNNAEQYEVLRQVRSSSSSVIHTALTFAFVLTLVTALLSVEAD